jgi:archaellum component FlaG (FlaF/FlaG flagellin family)
MFPQFKKLNNESGIVLFIVLMTAIIIMIFAVGIVTQSMNEINYAQQQIDQISADQLAKGIWWNAYASGMTNLPSDYKTNLHGGRNYNAAVSSLGSSPTGISSYAVSANYDTF